MSRIGKIKKKKSILEKQRDRTAFVFLLPALILILVFFITPIILSLRFSFTNWDGISKEYNFIGLNNFKYVVNDACFGRILLNTLYLMIIYVPVLNILAIVIAALIVNVKNKIGNFYKSVLFFPNLLSMTVVGFIWKLMYDYNNGLINTVFRKLKLDFLVQDWIGAKNLVIPSVAASIIWFALGYFLIIYIAGMMSIPIQLYEAADVEGATRAQKFFNVTLPLLAPSITINVVLSTMGIIATFDLPFVLTGGGPGFLSETLALKVYHYAFTNFQQGPALALAVILGIIAILIAFLELKILLKREDIY